MESRVNSQPEVIVIDEEDEEEMSATETALRAHFGHLCATSTDECSICSSETNNDNCFKTTCGHSFHTECIFKWMIQYENSSCPNCRNDFSAIKECKSFKKFLNQWKPQ